MRADVKLGMVISIAVVSIAGGYFAFRGSPEKPIQILTASDKAADRKAPNAADQAVGDRTAKPATTPNRNAARPASTPRNAGESRSPGAPVRQPLASGDQGATPVSAPPVTPGATPGASPAPSERVADATRDVPTGAVPSTVPQTGSEPPLTTPLAANTAKPVQPTPAASSNTLADASKSAPNTASPPIQPERPAPLSLTARTPAPTEASKRNGVDTDAAVDTHRVQTGDTMSSLAERYYGSAALTAFLVTSNAQLQEPNRLQVGQIVKIPPRPTEDRTPAKAPATTPTAAPSTTPAAGEPKAATKAPNTYTVKPGDSFYKIARDHLGDSARWKELYELNKQLVNSDPTRLKPGQVLTLPKS